MDFRAAIFDFDGTLVDSVHMWLGVYETLFTNHGLRLTDEIDRQARPMNLPEKCQWYHEHLGMGKSGEALYQELFSLAKEGYAHDVTLLPHAAEFLHKLHEEGIFLAVASTTPEPLVRSALAAFGLEGLFSEVICTTDVGRGKDHPDVYLEAAMRLGVTPSECWVFEDAPFALTVCKKTGFRTVGIVGEWGADDPVLVAQSDVLIHWYGELSVELLRDFEEAPVSTKGVLRALIVDGSPEPSSSALVRELAQSADYVIAADRGAMACHEAGVRIDVFCGDADSVTPEVAAWAREHATTDIRVTPEKYATDLALAIGCAEHEAARRGEALELTVTCASGGRGDHYLAAMGLLASHASAKPRLKEDSYECRILSPSGVASLKLGEEPDALGSTFSVIALGDKAVVSEAGVKWELRSHELGPLADLGVSNEVLSRDGIVTCEGGTVAVFLQK